MGQILYKVYKYDLNGTCLSYMEQVYESPVLSGRPPTNSLQLIRVLSLHWKDSVLSLE